MFVIRSSRWVCLFAFLGLFAPAVAAAAGDDSPARIRVSAVRQPAIPLPRWDDASPQKLVRIEQKLYQEDSGYYYRAVEDRIAVRLAPGIDSWEQLVEQAEPDVRRALQALTPLRVNRLGIVDLALPDSDTTYWAELVFETGMTRYAEAVTHGEWLTIVDDPLYPSQWGLNNTGQNGGTPGADVHAEAAWNIATGKPSVVVAILDSGTEVTHEDLAANIWVNEGEIPDNGVDDDGNGYVDDHNGWNFIGNDNELDSLNDHGTQVAGIIIAAGNNDTGVVGLADGLGSPGARGMPVLVGIWAPDNSILDDAILYAADNGAQVITLSLAVAESTAINDALEYALDTKDVFIGGAAGNNGTSVVYPARLPQVMAIAASDRFDTHADFSNPGPEVEVAAPGDQIESTKIGNTYGSGNGTSFAAPHVAALAALIRGVDPGLSAYEVRQLIIDTADDLETPGFDELTGHGRINAFQALSSLGSPDGTVELDAEVYACSGTLQVTVTDIDLVGDGTLEVTVTSVTEAVEEEILLTEGDAGVFSGSLPLGVGEPVPDGMLQVDHGDALSVTYIDFRDGSGALFVNKSVAATVDCDGPFIHGVSVTDINDTGATIIWNTDEVATGAVQFGEELPPPGHASSPEATLAHSVTLDDLDSCTNYRFRVESVDALGNPTTDDHDGVFYSFQTRNYLPGIGLTACAAGQPRLDADYYGCDETVEVSLSDLDLDTDPQALETAQVLLTSSSERDGEWITLTESAPSSSLFEGSIQLESLTTGNDGQLGVSAGDLITVTYFDEDDGTGSSHVASFTALADCVAPTIENLRVTAISATRAEIEWSTDELSDSRVEFGPTPALGLVLEDLQPKREHRLAISPFDACARIYFVVSSTDARGATGQAGDGGQALQFNANRIGGLVFHDNFETDTGWVLSGEWERGAPQGLGSLPRDPASAYSGANVLGTDLSGSGSYAGDYEPVVNESATSPPFDTLGIPYLELIFKRKLGVNSADTATVSLEFILSDEIWSSEGRTIDDDWTEARHFIGELGQASGVRIRFRIESIFPSHAFGWNIDEVIVKDATQADYLVCADCSGAPAFGGVTSVHDPDACAPTGLEIEWSAVPAWGTGGDGTYEIHRGTTAGFTPDEGNRIASGIGGTSWIDPSAPVDTTVWYLVRARNDEDCDGVGLADDNLVRLSATETVSQSPPTGVGQSVRVTSLGDAHVRLSWDPVPGAQSYIVRRSFSPDFDDAFDLGSTPETFFEHIHAAGDESFYAYRVFAVNACGQEGP